MTNELTFVGTKSIIHNSLLRIWCEAYMDSTLGCIGAIKETLSGISSEDWVTVCLFSLQMPQRNFIVVCNVFCTFS